MIDHVFFCDKSFQIRRIITYQASVPVTSSATNDTKGTLRLKKHGLECSRWGQGVTLSGKLPLFNEDSESEPSLAPSALVSAFFELWIRGLVEPLLLASAVGIQLLTGTQHLKVLSHPPYPNSQQLHLHQSYYYLHSPI